MTKELKVKQESDVNALPALRTTSPLPFGGNPLTFMRRFTEEMDKVFTDFGWGDSLAPMLGFVERELAPAMWSPKVEFVENKGQFLVRAELPGINRDDIHVELDKNALIIKGDRKHKETSEKDGYYRTEWSYGSFYRRLPLPAKAEAEKANATYHDGVLEIAMPMVAAETAVKRLEINAPDTTKAKSAKQ